MAPEVLLTKLRFGGVERGRQTTEGLTHALATTINRIYKDPIFHHGCCHSCTLFKQNFPTVPFKKVHKLYYFDRLTPYKLRHPITNTRGAPTHLRQKPNNNATSLPPPRPWRRYKIEPRRQLPSILLVSDALEAQEPSVVRRESETLNSEYTIPSR